MKKKTVIAALALSLFAASSALGQTLICTERTVDGTGENWYKSEKRMVKIAGEDRLVYDPTIVFEPNSSYAIVFYYLSIGGSPTSDSFAGTGEFTFPPQADGVEVQVHYQKSPSGDDWDVGVTEHKTGSQVARCPRMVVPKGSMISFVVRVVVEDWVPSGTPINIELKKLTGLYGVSLGEIPEVQIVTYTGPWKLKWLRQVQLSKVVLIDQNYRLIGVIKVPPSVAGGWRLESTGSGSFYTWTKVQDLVPPEGSDSVKVVVDTSKLIRQFYRVVGQ